MGGLEFTFMRILKIHRDIPMSGPQHTATQTRAIGQGYRLHGRDTDLKWGTQATDPIANAEVLDYTYAIDRFLTSVPMSSELRGYQDENRIAHVDDFMTEEGSFYDDVTKPSLLK